ncbi:MAG: anaerobic sulfatase maturase, partial [Lachnospiraceae bacterium]
MPAISVLIKPASGMCNMKCEYCFYVDEMKNRKQSNFGMMSEETLEHIISKTLAFAEEECNMAFQGGEPTLRGVSFFKKMIVFQKQYNQNNCAINNTIQTNGYNLTKEWCEFLKENNFLVGLSIDGVKYTHDIFRKANNGDESYQKIRESVALMNQYEVPYNILTVVHKRTAPAIRKIYQNYKKNGFEYQQYIACMEPFGEKRGETMYSLLPQVYGEFLKELFDLWYIDYQHGEQPCIRQFENYIGILLGYESEACEQRGHCSIQTVIEADGSVYPCDFYAIDQYCMGNLNENSLEEIYQSEAGIKFVKEGSDSDGTCRTCDYFMLCRGGCKRQKFQNEITGMEENYFCRSYQMFFDHSIGRMKEI